MEKILVTGDAGFIGSNLVQHLVNNTSKTVIIVDALAFVSNLESLNHISDSSRHHCGHVDIQDFTALRALFEKYQPDAVMYLVAGSRVDRSIERTSEYIQVNIIGTYNHLETALSYWGKLDEVKKWKFRFLYVSTDEVYGSLDSEGYFIESTAFESNPPYSVSKAPSDHLVIYASLITHAGGRREQSKQHTLDDTNSQNELPWTPKETFESGQWYSDNIAWSGNELDGNYQRERLGLSRIHTHKYA